MQRIIIFLITSILIANCNEGAAANTEQNNATFEKKGMDKNTNNNLIEFKVNGQLVRTSGWNISRFTLDGNSSGEWINIATNMHDDKRTINANLAGVGPGTYFFGDDVNLKIRSHGSFFPDYGGDMTNSFSFIKGVFSMTEIDTIKRIVNGTFSGTVINLQGETLEITDGKIINGQLKPGVTKY